MLSVFEAVFKTEEKLRQMELEMPNVPQKEYNAFMEQYSRLQHEFEESDGYSYQSRINGVLKGLGFTEEEYSQKVCTLSGGQKTRVFLGKLLLMKPDLLLLDEPTNHLDMYSKEILENAINSYEGTVLYISHDRYFIDKTAERVIELSKDGVTQYLGNYSYYMEKKAERERLATANAADMPALQSVKATAVSDSKADWLMQKEEQSKARKKANEIKKVEDEIEKTEARIAELDELLFTPEVNADTEKLKTLFDEKTVLETKLEDLYEKWEEIQ